MTARSAVVWRYLAGRGVKHAIVVDRGTHTGHRSTAVCGVAPAWFMPQDWQWLGTGKQSEYDAVEQLPECRRCTRLLT